jgi:hypothetical protein
VNTPSPAPENAEADSPNSRGGLPAWIPLLALLAAFVAAVAVGSQVVPLLSGLIFPPEPPLPTRNTNAIREIRPRESAGPGHDDWLYGTEMRPCDVQTYYENKLGSCQVDMENFCHIDPNWGMSPRDGSSFGIAVCTGTESIGSNYRVLWTVRIGAGYTSDGNTHIRIVRETTQ